MSDIIKDTHQIINRLPHLWVGDGVIKTWDYFSPVMRVDLLHFNKIQNLELIEKLKKTALWSHITMPIKDRGYFFYINYRELGFKPISEMARERKVLTFSIYHNKEKFDWECWQGKKPTWLVREKGVKKIETNLLTNFNS